MEIQLNDGRVEVDVEGQGPPLVLIHSLLTDAHGFDTVAPILARSNRVFRVSLPGFGNSTPIPISPARVTIEDLADRVADTMTELGCGSDTAVLGNGLGGFVAVALAIHHGKRFGRLIPSNCGAAFPDSRRAAFATMARLVAEGGMEAVVDVAVRRIFTAPYLEAHPAVIAERRAVLVQVDPGAFGAACHALETMDLRPDLGRIHNPTFVIAGGADETTPPELADELAEGIAGAEVTTIDNCGHCPQLERPEAFLSVVGAILTR